MFEINLVPQIKRDALRTQKIRNIVIFCCIILAVGCGILLTIFGTTYGVQRAITASRTNQIRENFDELEEIGDLRYYLTIQNQLAELNEIAQQKSVFSRVLNIVSDIIPRDNNGDPLIQFTELNYNVNDFRVSFDAQSIHGFPALNALERTMELLHFDFGVYRGPDGSEVQVIREGINTDPDSPQRGIIYGVVLAQDGSEIRIYRDRRDYHGFHFDSACLAADGITSHCKLIPDDSIAEDSAPTFEIGAGGTPTLRFRLSFSIAPEALNIQSRFVRVLGITRQDVTDSFLQINNNWFAPAPTPQEDQL
jgi:hypothetical protein